MKTRTTKEYNNYLNYLKKDQDHICTFCCLYIFLGNLTVLGVLWNIKSSVTSADKLSFYF